MKKRIDIAKDIKHAKNILKNRDKEIALLCDTKDIKKLSDGFNKYIMEGQMVIMCRIAEKAFQKYEHTK